MIRRLFSLLLVVLFSAGATQAQHNHVLPCQATEVNNSYKESFPEIQKYEDQLRAYIKEEMKSLKLGNRSAAKGTFGPDDILHIPVVVHVVHDYGTTDYVTDDRIHQLLAHINETFMKENADTNQVITPWKPYIGNPKVMFHLAQKDPLGNPTTGITRRQSYLTDGGDDQAKFDQWDPSSYLNIWIIRRIGRGISSGVVAAYAVFPASAAAFPYTDGIISSAGQILNNKTIPHEIGHILNLIHTWGNIQVATNCSGDDEVDDTTPTSGHFGSGNPFGNTANGNCNTASLYDTSCTNNETSLSKILLDQTLSPQTSSTNGIGFDYEPKTTLTLTSIDIYPTAIGKEFAITNYIGNTVMNEIKAKPRTIGKGSLNGGTMVASTTGANDRSQIVFDVQKHLILDSVFIYPNTIGGSYTIQVLKLNNDTVKTVSGTTTTNTGKQKVAIDAFLVPATGYKLRIVTNPGLKCDSIKTSELNSWTQSRDGAISFVHDVDSTNRVAGTSPTAYKGRYNYFYDWRFRYDGLTTTDSGVQTVNLGWVVTPPSKYSLKLSTNPGVMADSIGAAPYVKSVPCVLDISNETAANRFNGLYKLQIRYGYIKDCIDYPDTVNTQNIMDYANCPRMFTKLQVARMRATLGSNVGNRNRLVNDTTHVRTGILTGIGGTYKPLNDMKPVPDFSVETNPGPNRMRTYYQCASETFRFKNRSWRDTVTSSTWTFSNGASNNNVNETELQIKSQASNVQTSFAQPGWVDVTLKSTGNNTGDTTETRKQVVYAADPNFTINPLNGFYMDFDKNDNSANNDLNKWPMFNYYNNEFKWEIDEKVGYYDNSSIKFSGYDSRVAPFSYNGTPKGDFDDFFTPAFDLSGMTTTECRLNFLSAGAFRVTNSQLMKDTLEIAYSTDCGNSWTTFGYMDKDGIASKGTVVVPFAPLWEGDWKLNSFNVPNAARTGRVFFRFRYRPGVDDVNGAASRTLPGTGNNFYIDRINVSAWAAGVNTLLADGKNISLAPNPTNGSTQLVIRSNSRDMANIQVTDVTGKVVYSIQHQLNGNINNIEIPATAIKVKGVYMVHVLAGAEKYTEKLVSY